MDGRYHWLRPHPMIHGALGLATADKYEMAFVRAHGSVLHSNMLANSLTELTD